MNKLEFMKELEELLINVPSEEKAEAIQYYEAYFDDAGIENEAKIIEELENPQKVASIIKAGLSNEEDKGEFTETGYNDERFKDRKEVVDLKKGFNSEKDETYEESTKSYKEDSTNKKEVKPKDPNRSAIKIILIVVLCLIASPVIFSVGGGLIGLVFAIFGIMIGIIAGAAGLSIGCLIGGVVAIVAGCAQLVASPATGIFTIGAGLVIFAFGILMTILLIWIIIKAIPWMFRAITSLIGRLFNRKGGRE